MSDDVEEFMEVATADSSKSRETSVPSRRARPLNDVLAGLQFASEDEEEIKPGKLTQYALVGGGYGATTATIQRLPADCYKISFTNSGVPYLDPQKLTCDDLLHLPDSKSDEVIKEVKRFWELKSRFKDFGFAHKRGFLLFGPPGSGKTSTIQMVINDMIKMGGIVILADHPSSLETILKQVREVEPERPIVVIWEDIDTVIQKNGETEVLSLLDGESQVENIVFIATTNYPENLDGRIINRPSRFDKVVKIDMPNSEARKTFLMNKIKTTEKDGMDLVKETEGLSIAHIKELIISVWCQEVPIEQAIRRLQRMKYTPKSSDAKGPLGIN